jgi:hypothetical protein
VFFGFVRLRHSKSVIDTSFCGKLPAQAHLGDMLRRPLPAERQTETSRVVISEEWVSRSSAGGSDTAQSRDDECLMTRRKCSAKLRLTMPLAQRYSAHCPRSIEPCWIMPPDHRSKVIYDRRAFEPMMLISRRAPSSSFNSSRCRMRELLTRPAIGHAAHQIARDSQEVFPRCLPHDLGLLASDGSSSQESAR